jgi:hypothetical protein
VRHHPRVASSPPLVSQQLERIRAIFAAGNLLLEESDPDGSRGARVPFVDGLDESTCEFSVEDFRGVPCVVLEFSHDSAPTVRFLHRFRPPGLVEDDDDGTYELVEGVDCQWLLRSRVRVGADATLVWTDFSWGHPTQRLGWAMDLIAQRWLAEAAEWLRGPDAAEWDLALADDLEALVASGAPRARDLHALNVRCREAIPARHAANRTLMRDFGEAQARSGE